MAFNPNLYYEHYYREGQTKKVELVPEAADWPYDALVALYGVPEWGIDAELVRELL